MDGLWHWLRDRRLRDDAFTPQAPSDRAHPQDWTPIIGMTEDAYLQWLIGSLPWL